MGGSHQNGNQQEIIHLMWRITQGAGIVKDWEDKRDRRRIPDIEEGGWKGDVREKDDKWRLIEGRHMKLWEMYETLWKNVNGDRKGNGSDAIFLEGRKKKDVSRETEEWETLE